MPTVVTGRSLGVERNGEFTDANTAPIPGGRLWTPAAASWNDMRRAALSAGVAAWEFMPAGPRSSARTIDAQRYFYAHQPPAAAFPGTSNHGWGIAVDVATRRAASWIMRNGPKYGWSWDEGKRVGEWWHYRYLGGYTPKKDPLGHLLPDERRWCREYDRLVREKKDEARRKVLRRVMSERAVEIRTAARNGSWDRRNRTKRYRSLRARAT